MCIAAFIWQAHPLYPMILVQNRDEYLNRPTKPMKWWEEGRILGGKDEVAGGTWLACSREGRVALLTNVLEPQILPKAKSRGDLPVLFLESTKSPREFAEHLVTEADKYNGFNLIVADMNSNTMVYVTNRPKGEPVTIQEVSPGIHVLSNAKLDSPWHKAVRLGQNFKELLKKYGERDLPVKEMVEKLLKDTAKADKSCLPGICSLDWEYNTSSVYVKVDTSLGRYGTRSSAVLTVRTNGEVRFYEKYLEKDLWKEKTVKYQIMKQKIELLESSRKS